MSWNAATITAAIVAGCVLFAIFFYLIALISVPAIVFFPAYSIYFFAARYRPLSLALYPPPPGYSPPSEPPPMYPTPNSRKQSTEQAFRHGSLSFELRHPDRSRTSGEERDLACIFSASLRRALHPRALAVRPREAPSDDAFHDQVICRSRRAPRRRQS